jgi:hypothetical protein
MNQSLFIKWLMKQAGRDDPVGDLARDARDATPSPSCSADLGRAVELQGFAESRGAYWDALQEFWVQMEHAESMVADLGCLLGPMSIVEEARLMALLNKIIKLVHEFDPPVGAEE